MQITDLGGHSGCRILLCENEDNKVFVRKISSSKEYNERLKVQCEKQNAFTSSQINAPRVLNCGYTEDGLYYFDMEYIQGITLAEYMKSIRIGDVRKIVKTIVYEIIKPSDPDLEKDRSIFAEKIKSLKIKLQGKNSTIDEALKLLSRHSWDRFPKTGCHGDLTLENIIIKDNQLYLIDFLDSFYDSWILDISTLMQDVQTLWSYRNDKEVDINTILRLIVFRDILMDTVREISPDDYLEVYYALLLKLIRIFPYTKDEHTYYFLIKKTRSIIDIIEKGENNENVNRALCGGQNN